MATSKTLAPTNVTISIPAMADAPDASVFSNCVDKEADAINALNSHIGTDNSRVGTDVQTYLNSLAVGHYNVAFAYNAPGLPTTSTTDLHIFIWDSANHNGVVSAVNTSGENYTGTLLNGVLTWAGSNQMARKAEKRVQGGETASFTFSSYNTSALIFGSVGDSDAILYVYSNGYLVSVKTSSRMTVSLSEDYKTVTVSISSGTGHIGCISANLQPTVS